jgi:hypothetical protein
MTKTSHGPVAPAAVAARDSARLRVNIALAVIVAALLAFIVVSPHIGSAQASEKVPRSAGMETTTGVRFSRIAVVGDGGLLTVSYVVLDPERATAFQSDRDHPPRLTSDDRHGGTSRASIMRAGHQMRAGQTYYLVYENTDGAIRSGEEASVSYGGQRLRHVPVL